MGPRYVYALGSIDARFPLLATEKEFAQAVGRSDAHGKTDRQAFHSVLARREYRYLARQLCWVFSVQGLEAYVLQPRDPADFDLLIDALQEGGDAESRLSCLVGLRGQLANPERCNGLTVPIVHFDQIYTFEQAALLRSISRPENMAPDVFAAASRDLFQRVLQATENTGASDADRAINYLALRYPAIYARAAESVAHNFTLVGLDVRPSGLSGARKVMDVVFTYNNRTTDFSEQFLVRVDVTEEFPFLASKLSPYYERTMVGA